MEPNLKILAEESRGKRHAAVALILSALVLAAFTFFMPSAPPDMLGPAAPVLPPDPFANVSLIARSAIVLDLTTGETLFEKEAEAQLPLASLTKLLTLYAASETLSPSFPVAISEAAIRQEGDSGFSAGETFAFSDLARFALVASSNDAAFAIAEAAAGARALSGDSLLASAAEAAGLSQTYAVNGTGLDASTAVAGGYGSARDVALLAQALMEKAPDIARAATDASIIIRSAEGKDHSLKNTNPDIATLSGLVFSKTGYTDLAGGNLVVVFDAGILHPVAVAVLGSTREGRFRDAERLMLATRSLLAGVELP